MASEHLKNYLRNNCRGRRGTTKYEELEKKLRTSEKELRRQVNRLRRNKVPVCSGPNGIFYAKNAGEVFATICYLREKLFGLEEAIAGLEAALEGFGEEQDGAGTDS